MHTSHCCAKHGCKYGDAGCPVEKGGHAQENLCERCEDDVIELKANEAPAEAYARSVVKMDLDGGNFVLVDGEKVRLERLSTKTGAKAQYVDMVWAVKLAYLAGVSRA